MTNFQNDQILFEMLKKHEGYRLKPYTDTEGYLTIGIGRNLSTQGISALEAELMCLNDIGEAQKQIRSHFPWFDKLSLPRQRALLDMSFMGIGKMMQFDKMIEAIVNGDYYTASMEMLHSKWAKQVGVRAMDLAAIMRNDK